MKKVLVLVAALSLFAAPAIAAVSGTAHDLSSIDTGTNTEVCVYCHTPHGADISVANAPLWNRGTTNATGNTYTGLDLEVANATLAVINQTDAPLCLSCHDGASLNAVLNNPPNSGTVTLGANQVGANANIGADLSNDHPIGFNYETVQGLDNEIILKGTVEGAAGMTGAVSYNGGNDMWCSSCHDVHDNTNGAFLRVNNAGSNLCTTCHVK